MKKENEYYRWREDQPDDTLTEAAICLVVALACIAVGIWGFLHWVDHLPPSPAERDGQVERGPTQ